MTTLAARELWEISLGEIPGNLKVFFIDGDERNITISNLELISPRMLKHVRYLVEKEAEEMKQYESL